MTIVTVCRHKQRDSHPALPGINHCHMSVSVLTAWRWKTKGIAVRAYDHIATDHDTVPAYETTHWTLLSFLSAWTRIKKGQSDACIGLTGAAREINNWIGCFDRVHHTDCLGCLTDGQVMCKTPSVYFLDNSDVTTYPRPDNNKSCNSTVSRIVCISVTLEVHQP